MSTPQKQELERQIEVMRRQALQAQQEQKRLQDLLDKYDTLPQEPEDNSVLTVHLPRLGADVPLVRQGKTWYVFFPNHDRPGQHTWEGLCKFLSAVQHSGVHTVSENPWQEAVIPSNTP